MLTSLFVILAMFNMHIHHCNRETENKKNHNSFLLILTLGYFREDHLGSVLKIIFWYNNLSTFAGEAAK